MGTLEHRARTAEAGAPEQRGPKTRLRCPTRVHALRPAAFGEVLDDAARHRASDAQRVDEPSRLEPEGGADAGRRCHGAEHRRRVEARLVHRLGHHQAQPADRLHAGGDAEERGSAVEPFLLRGGEDRGYDDGARVDRAALERIVEVLSVRRGAVDEGSRRCPHLPGVSDRGRRARVRAPGGERRPDVIRPARHQAEADDVDQEPLAGLADRGGQAGCLQRRDALGESFGDGPLAAHQ